MSNHSQIELVELKQTFFKGNRLIHIFAINSEIKSETKDREGGKVKFNRLENSNLTFKLSDELLV